MLWGPIWVLGGARFHHNPEVIRTVVLEDIEHGPALKLGKTVRAVCVWGWGGGGAPQRRQHARLVVRQARRRRRRRRQVEAFVVAVGGDHRQAGRAAEAETAGTPVRHAASHLAVVSLVVDGRLESVGGRMVSERSVKGSENSVS